jgi:hypothetical protein
MLLGGVTVFYLWPLLLPGLIYTTALDMLAGFVIHFIGKQIGMKQRIRNDITEVSPI